MLQYSARLSAELWEWAPPSCNAAEELQLCWFVFLRQDMAMNCGCRERSTKLYLLHTFTKLANPLPNQSSHSHLHPAGAASVGHFQVGERLQLSVVAILGMLFYRLDVLRFGWNERVWHKISKSQTQTGSFSGAFSMCFFPEQLFINSF